MQVSRSENIEFSLWELTEFEVRYGGSSRADQTLMLTLTYGNPLDLVYIDGNVMAYLPQ